MKVPWFYHNLPVMMRSHQNALVRFHCQVLAILKSYRHLQCSEAQVSVFVDDRNEIPNVDAAMLLTQCSDPGEAALVAQCSGGHVAQTTGGVPGDDSIGHAFLANENEALLNLQVFVHNSDQSVVDPRYFHPMAFAEIGAWAGCPSCIDLFV
jgi:hypothetical protein